jgi:hypothetical protein
VQGDRGDRYAYVRNDAGQIVTAGLDEIIWTCDLPNRVRRDCTGMSWLMKAIEDGLVLAGTIPGDDWRYVRTTTMRVLPPTGEAGVMTLTITEADR